jgi:hypothetical protein
MSEVLALDWGTTIVRVLDITTDVYRAYRSPKERLEGAKRIVGSKYSNLQMLIFY